MGVLITGEQGAPLRNILKYYNDRDFSCIYVRCAWTKDDESYDELIGSCKYEDKKLIPLDGDTYSLDDRYIKWEVDDDIMTAWESGRISDDWQEIYDH